MFINQAIQFLAKMYMLQLKTRQRFSIELVSGPGLGKSEAMDQVGVLLSKKLKRDFLVKQFMLTSVEPIDLRGIGLPTTDTDGNPRCDFTQAAWTIKANEPKFGIVFLDEFGQADQTLQKPAAELLLHGRVGDSVLPITYMVTMASNRLADRSGVARSLAFVENRKLTLNIEPSLEAWVEWAETNAIHPLAIAWVKRRPSLVFQDKVPDKPGPFCTPRTIVKTSHLIGELDMNELTEASAGYMGEGTGADFIAFLRVAEQLPSFEEIAANPTKAMVPEREDAIYAVTQMVSHSVTPPTSRAAFSYLKRLGQEYQVTGLKSIIRRCPEMLESPEFAVWLKEQKDLILAANLVDTATR